MEKLNTENTQNIFIAGVMADTYQNGLQEDGTLNAKSKEILFDIFGDVPEDDRAVVYLTMTSILKDRGLDVNPTVVQEPVMH